MLTTDGERGRMRDIYRSEHGRETVQRWCVERLANWPVEHRRGTIVAGGTETHLVHAGSGPRTVVLVPGTNFNAAACLPLATALADRFRLVVTDVPGQPGLSSGHRPPAERRAAWYRDWLAGVLEQIGEPVVLIGHSLGAAIALNCDSPQVYRQVLLSPGGLVRARLGPEILTAAVAWLTRRNVAASTRLLATMHAPGNQPRPELADWMALVAQHVRTSLDPGLAPTPGGLVDRLVLTGEHDDYYPPRALAGPVREKLGQELAVFPGVGHLLIDERPEAIASLLDR